MGETRIDVHLLLDEAGDGAARLFVVRSVRGGAGMEFVSGFRAAMAAAAEDRAALMNALAGGSARFGGGVACRDHEGPEAAHVPEGSRLKAFTLRGRDWFFLLSPSGLPCGDPVLDPALALEAFSPPQGTAGAEPP